MIKQSETIYTEFCTYDNTTGASANADSLPIGTLVQNGNDTTETVTISNKTTGVYKATITVPTGYSIGDKLQIRIEVTVNGITAKAIVWGDYVDSKLNGDLNDPTAAESQTDVSVINNIVNDIKTHLSDGGRIDILLDTINAKTAAQAGADGDTLKTLSDQIDAIEEDVFSKSVEGSLTFEDIIKILLAVAAGESSGGGTANIKFRDQADTKNRIEATVDSNGNRININVDGS